MGELIYLSSEYVRQVMTTEAAIPLVEEAFRAHAEGRAHMPSKVYLNLPGIDGDFRAMPAYIESSKACGIKWVNVHPGNMKKGLPSVMAMILLNDAETGMPLAVLDGTTITNMRTGAAGGVAAKYLAREDSSVVGLVGCGAQAVTQWDAVKSVRKIREVRVWGHESGLAETFIAQIKKGEPNFHAVKTVRECVIGADIVITTTPVRKPIVEREWIAPGTHINAIGADAAGKEELDPAILLDGVVVVDDIEQASHSGEVNVPLREGVMNQSHIRGTLGEIMTGHRPGRKDREEITVFDSTGLAIQDIAVAWKVFSLCMDRKLGQRLVG